MCEYQLLSLQEFARVRSRHRVPYLSCKFVGSCFGQLSAHCTYIILYCLCLTSPHKLKRLYDIPFNAHSSLNTLADLGE